MKILTFMSIVEEIRSLENGTYNDRQASITLKNILLAEYDNDQRLVEAFDNTTTNIDEFYHIWSQLNPEATNVPPTDAELANESLETIDPTQETPKKKNTKK